MRVDVALVANRAYLGPLIVTAASVLRFSRKGTVVHIHLFLEDVDDVDFKQSKATLESLGGVVHRHCFDMSSLANMKAWRGDAGTKNVWIRTFFCDLLPEVEWLVYMDCDVLCLRPIESLVDQGEKDKAIVAVRDESFVMRRRESNWAKEKCGIELLENDYFNAGVLLFNLSRCRLLGLSRMVQEFVVRYGCPYALDQTTLNILLRNEVKLVGTQFNRAQVLLGSEGYDDAPIIHYCCGVPWSRSPFIPASRRTDLWWSFWRSLSASAKCPIIDELKLPIVVRIWKRLLAKIIGNRLLYLLFSPPMNLMLKLKGYSLMNEVKRFWHDTDATWPLRLLVLDENS